MSTSQTHVRAQLAAQILSGLLGGAQALTSERLSSAVSTAVLATDALLDELERPILAASSPLALRPSAGASSGGAASVLPYEVVSPGGYGASGLGGVTEAK